MARYHAYGVPGWHKTPQEAAVGKPAPAPIPAPEKAPKPEKKEAD